jgi:hypothetical protein
MKSARYTCSVPQITVPGEMVTVVKPGGTWVVDAVHR